jgi:putative transposase
MNIYHVFNKSIAKFKIFPNHSFYVRFLELITYYKNNPFIKFSEYKKLKNKLKSANCKNNDPIVQIIAYCIMPTHFHLVIYEKENKALSHYMRRILDSYTRYFNKKTKRQGPLWVGKFKKVLVTSDEQLLHLTRYVHLNPVSAGLVEKPEDWPYSSYREYIERNKVPKMKISSSRFDMSDSRLDTLPLPEHLKRSDPLKIVHLRPKH